MRKGKRDGFLNHFLSTFLQANSPPLLNTNLQRTQRSVSNWSILFPIAKSLCLNRVGFV